MNQTSKAYRRPAGRQPGRSSGRRCPANGSFWRTVLLTVVLTVHVPAMTLQETFDTDPLLAGWSVHGDASMFGWDSTNKSLCITWDSSMPNSYFHRPLQTVLARTDDFQITATLRLDEVATGTTEGKDSTFQLAFGLARWNAISSTNFLRATGVNAVHGPRDLVEFDYFPESLFGFGATVSPTLVSSNNEFASSFTFPLDLPQGVWLRIRLSYTASNSTLSTVVQTNGTSIGPIADTTLGETFSDFRLDTLVLSSYSDEGQSPPEGSIRARGVFDDIMVILPDPPIASIALVETNGLPGVLFQAQPTWNYTLERRTALTAGWEAVAMKTGASANPLHLVDTNPPPTAAFYRIRADRP